MAEALFPVVVGRLRDGTGSYTAGFWLLAGLAAAGALAGALLPSTRRAWSASDLQRRALAADPD